MTRMKTTLFLLLLCVATAGAAPRITLSGSTGFAPNPFNLITDDNDSDNTDTPSTSNSTEFGSVRVGGLLNKFFRVQNIGDSTLTITRAEAPADDFTIIGLTDRSLEPQEIVDFRVRFRPSTTGAQTLRLEFDSDTETPSERTFSFRVRGTGTNSGPSLSVTSNQPGTTVPIPDDDDTPSVAEGTDITHLASEFLVNAVVDFTLENTGNETLELSEESLNGADPLMFRITQFPSSIEPGETENMRLVYFPSDQVNHRATLSFITNDTRTGRERFQFTVEARRVLVGEFSVNEPNTDWGNEGVTTVGNGRTFTISNDGLAPIEIISFDVLAGPTGTQEWSVIPPGTPTLAADAETDFFVQPRIMSIGDVSSTIRIRYRSYPGGPEQEYTVVLSAFGIGGELTVLGGGKTVDDGDFSPRLDNLTDFGTIYSGVSPNLTHTFTLRNTGNRTLTILDLGGFTASLAYSGVPLFGNGDLDPGEEFQMPVGFNEPTRGIRRADLVITADNGFSEISHSFRVVGRSYAAGEPLLAVFGKNPPVEIPLAARAGDPDDGTDFGDVLVGTNAVQIFTVRNLGDAPLVLDGDPTMFPGRVVQFDVLGTALYNASTPIPPGEERQFFLSVNTNTAGSLVDTVTIRSNNPVRPEYSFGVTANVVDSLPLPVTITGGTGFGEVVPTGAGVMPSLAAGTDFGLQQLGNFVTARSFRITNDSNVADHDR